MHANYSEGRQKHGQPEMEQMKANIEMPLIDLLIKPKYKIYEDLMHRAVFGWVAATIEDSKVMPFFFQIITEKPDTYNLFSKPKSHK